MGWSTDTGRIALGAGRPLTWARRLPLDTWAGAGVGALALVSRLMLLSVYSAEYDEGVYWQSLRAMAAGHPLFRQVFSSQPPLFLLSVYPFYWLGGQTLGAARLGVLVYSLVGLAALYTAGRLAGGRWAGVIAAALATADPLFLHASVTLEAEGPSVALGALAVALALATVRAPAGRRRWLALATGAALMAAILIKLFAVTALVPVAVILMAPGFTSSRQGSRREGTASERLQAALPRFAGGWLDWSGSGIWRHVVAADAAWCGVGMLGVALAVLLPFAPSWGDLTVQTLGMHLSAAGATGGGLRAHGQIIAHSPLWAALALPGLAAVGLLLWQRVWALVTPLLWAAVALAALLRLQPLFAHHVVLLSPPLALAGGVALAHGLRASGAPRARAVVQVPTVRLAAAAVLALALLGGAVKCLGAVTAARAYVPTTQLQMAAALEMLTARRDTIVSDDPYVVALADRAVPPQLVDTSSVRIASGYLTAAQLETLIGRDHARAVLFASGRFEQLRSFQMWVAADYRLAKTFGDGHALYLR